MSDTTRLAFVKRSAAAAAGMTVVGAVVAEDADAKARKAAQKSGPVVAYIKKPSNGEIVVMHGKKQVKVHNKKLAAQIAHHTS